MSVKCRCGYCDWCRKNLPAWAYDHEAITERWMDEGRPGPKPHSLDALYAQMDRADEIEAAEEHANEALSETTNPDELWERVRT